MKTDYYVLLEVEQTATSLELKKAYRKKALQLHPDKNPDDVENTTRLFNEVRVAYETLSDPQERSWYDSHKFQILMEDGDRDSGLDYNDYDANSNSQYSYYAGTTVDDIEKYFNNNLYQNFNDSINGFYSVVSVLLDKIASEEVSTGKEQRLPGYENFKDDTSFATVCDPKELLYPRMGNSKTDFESTRIFYKIWGNFQTVKTFNWADEYRYSSAPDRRTRRIMEKENKKLRDQARKNFNDIVKKYISYIKKLDPRMDPKIRKVYEKQKLAEQREEIKRQAQVEKQERQRQRQFFHEQDWQAVDPDELAEIEAQLDKIYQEEKRINGEESDDEDFNNDVFECIICDKIFKSEKQFMDHERSKKHLKLLKQLQWEMKKEGIELGIDEGGYIKEDIDDFADDIDYDDDNDDLNDFDDALESFSDLDDLTNEELQRIIEQQMEEELMQNDFYEGKNENIGEDKNDNINNVIFSDNDKIDEIDDEIDDDIYGEDTNVETTLQSNTNEKKFRGKTRTDEKLEELSNLLNKSGIDSDDDTDWGLLKPKGKLKKGKNKSRSNDSSQKTSDILTEKNEKCSVCKQEFSSRNKLFQHVNSTGHAAPPSKIKKGKKKGTKN